MALDFSREGGEVPVDPTQPRRLAWTEKTSDRIEERRGEERRARYEEFDMQCLGYTTHRYR